MTDNNSTNRERLENIWIRLIYMVLFFVTHRLSSFVLMIIAAIQFCLTLFKGNKDIRLNDFSTSLNKYIYQCGIFLSFESEEKPFPFNGWPTSEESVAKESSTKEPVVEEPAVEKTAAVKKPGKKAAPKAADTKTSPKRKPRAKKETSPDSNNKEDE